MKNEYRCYNLDSDNRGRTLATIRAKDALGAVAILVRNYPGLSGKIEIWHDSDRVLTVEQAAT